MKRIRAVLVTLVAVTLCGLSKDNVLRSFDGATAWLNSASLSPDYLRGKVVLVDFWEYTCVNCLRTLPYLRAWYNRYRHDGFVIVGVHTPEFAFSAERENVSAAAKRLGVGWPIALDAHQAIWNRYDAEVWPRGLLYDQQGHLVEDVRGEGGYPHTESMIQALLKRADPKLALPPVMQLLPQDSYDKPGALCYPHTAELLVAHSAIANAETARRPNSEFGAFAPLSDVNFPSHYESYVDPAQHRDGALYLHGKWQVAEGAAVSASTDGYLALRYHAIEVDGVMRPIDPTPIRVNVTQDGQPIPRDDAGSDVHYSGDGTSYVTVDAARSYQLVMNAHFGQHELRLMPQHFGLALYDFAFESCEVPGAKGGSG